jgi:hypothetical protein
VRTSIEKALKGAPHAFGIAEAAFLGDGLDPAGPGDLLGCSIWDYCACVQSKRDASTHSGPPSPRCAPRGITLSGCSAPAATAQSGGTCRNIGPSSRRSRAKTRDKRSFPRPAPGRSPKAWRALRSARSSRRSHRRSGWQKPGCRQFAVTPVPRRRRASSRVKRMLQSLERP